MFHNTEDQILKQEILRKRATGRKSIIKTYGLKTRLFILTTSHLSYYDGNEEVDFENFFVYLKHTNIRVYLCIYF